MKIHFISTFGFLASDVAINFGEKTKAKIPDKKAKLNSSQRTKKSSPNLKIRKKTAEEMKFRKSDLFLALMIYPFVETFVFCCRHTSGNRASATPNLR